jgi:hypothetical protein
MVSPDDAEDDWIVERLTTDHNGDNDAEVERVQQAHPGEPECVLDRRVLGALAPFRCASTLLHAFLGFIYKDLPGVSRKNRPWGYPF